jgi:SAM-dependent methyltransferase
MVVSQQPMDAKRKSLDEATAGLWAVAALGRLAESGTLARLAERRQPVEDPVELADARLLAAFGLLEERDGEFTICSGLASTPILTADSGAAFARTQLLQAIGHTRGQPAGWHSDDGAVLVAQGRASIHLAAVIEARLLPLMPEAETALRSGGGKFLDVGVGVAALSIAIAERFPGTKVVGVDVLCSALEIARTQIAVAGLRDAIELRQQSVGELTDTDFFDLAWIPQMFIAPAELDAGLARVHAALRPGGWLILALAAGDSDDGADRVEAYQTLLATTLGGGPMSADEGSALLDRYGYEHAETIEGAQPLLLARRPASDPSKQVQRRHRHEDRQRRQAGPEDEAGRIGVVGREPSDGPDVGDDRGE